MQLETFFFPARINLFAVMFVLSLGMMIETMAGKSAALHGLCHDCTPFTFSEDSPAVDYFGKLLVKGSHELVKTGKHGEQPRVTLAVAVRVNVDHLETSASSKTFTPSPFFFCMTCSIPQIIHLLCG